MNKKRFVISGIPLCETITGIPRYMYEVLTRLEEMIANYNDIELIICYPEERNIVPYDFKNIKLVKLKHGNKKWFKDVVFPFSKKNNAIICDMADGICIQKGEIIKIDDMRPYTKKNFDPLKRKIYFRLVLFAAKLNASTVITVSESQKLQLQKYMPDKDIRIFPNGWDHVHIYEPDETIFAKNTLIKRGEYYYSLGSVAKHKNYKWIIEVAKRNQDKQFVVAGNTDLKKWDCGVEGFGSLENVIYVGYVSDQENTALYKNCKAFLHPAYYEGFGMPPMEAFSFGKNLAVSDIPEFRETYGNKISYFLPDDYEFNLDSIKSVSLKDRNEILCKFSWDKTAKLWLDLFLKYCK